MQGATGADAWVAFLSLLSACQPAKEAGTQRSGNASFSRKLLEINTLMN
jgi:hypothetical protein